MMNFICSHISPLTASFGLICDIIGAFFVAFEVVKQYRGKKFHTDPSWEDMKEYPKETDEYAAWEATKYKHMKIGLFFLVVGFLLQIVASWMS